jgi:vacuolar protein sorting-associated protein 35
MVVTEELRYLGDHLISEGKKGVDIVTYYTEVQYINSILPRLYLLITVGRACVLSREEEGLGRMLLRDLVEMCRGVQHPLRGLFLRNYLLQVSWETHSLDFKMMWQLNVPPG